MSSGKHEGSIRFRFRISSSWSFVVVALLAFPTAKWPLAFFLDVVMHTSPDIRTSHLAGHIALLRGLLDRYGCGVAHIPGVRCYICPGQCQAWTTPIPGRRAAQSFCRPSWVPAKPTRFRLWPPVLGLILIHLAGESLRKALTTTTSRGWVATNLNSNPKTNLWSHSNVMLDPVHCDRRSQYTVIRYHCEVSEFVFVFRCVSALRRPPDRCLSPFGCASTSSISIVARTM
jgi:hypothetical protein